MTRKPRNVSTKDSNAGTGAGSKVAVPSMGRLRALGPVQAGERVGNGYIVLRGPDEGLVEDPVRTAEGVPRVGDDAGQPHADRPTGPPVVPQGVGPEPRPRVPRGPGGCRARAATRSPPRPGRRRP